MLGAIIGDIAGSYYENLEMKKMKSGRSYEEKVNIMNPSIPLFTQNSSATDDSILTMAIYDACLNDGDYEKYLKKYTEREIKKGSDKYGRNRFSPEFIKWVKGQSEGKSYGNGAAMRISPVGYLYDSLEIVKEETKKATIPSHNSKEALKSAEAISTSIYLIRNGIDKNHLKKYIEENYYSLDFDIEALRHNYKFTSKAKDTIPQAIYIFLISKNFEDSIRKAISIGGDCDTIASITAALSEAYYGIPNHIIKEVKPYLKDYMYELLKEKYYSDKTLKKE